MASVTTSHGELLHLVRAREGLSRQQLMAETGMSRGTLYSRLDALVRLGLVYEAEPLGATGGRRARRIRFEDRGRVVLVVDLGQTHARVAVTDLLGSEQRRADLPLHIADGASGRARRRCSTTPRSCWPPDAGSGSVGVGVGVPASVEPGDGPTAVRLGHAGLAGRRIVGPCAPGSPCRWWWRTTRGRARWGSRGRTTRPCVYVKIATGIGCGIVVGGEPLRGAGGLAGAIGHVRIGGPHGAPAPRCRCGRTGCLAVHSSGLALLERLRPELARRHARRRAAAERRGRRRARGRRRHPGRALAPTVAMLNPHRLVLGGPLGARPSSSTGCAIGCGPPCRSRAGRWSSAARWAARATPRGLARLVVRRVFAPAAVDAVVARAGG